MGYSIFSHVGDEMFGDYARIEDEYLYNEAGSVFEDAIAFTKAEATDGVALSTAVSLVTIVPSRGEDGSYDGRCKFGFVSVDLDTEPVEDLAWYVDAMECNSISEFAAKFDQPYLVGWKQSLGELLCRGRIQSPDFEWVDCPSGPAAMRLVNMTMRSHLPEDWLKDTDEVLGGPSAAPAQEAMGETVEEFLDASAYEPSLGDAERGGLA